VKTLFSLILRTLLASLVLWSFVNALDKQTDPATPGVDRAEIIKNLKGEKP